MENATAVQLRQGNKIRDSSVYIHVACHGTAMALPWNKSDTISVHRSLICTTEPIPHTYIYAV